MKKRLLSGLLAAAMFVSMLPTMRLNAAAAPISPPILATKNQLNIIYEDGCVKAVERDKDFAVGLFAHLSSIVPDEAALAIASFEDPEQMLDVNGDYLTLNKQYKNAKIGAKETGIAVMDISVLADGEWIFLAWNDLQPMERARSQPLTLVGGKIVIPLTVTSVTNPAAVTKKANDAANTSLAALMATLPSTVDCTMSDGSTKAVNVTWADNANTYNQKGCTLQFNGTLAATPGVDLTGAPANIKTSITVTPVSIVKPTVPATKTVMVGAANTDHATLGLTVAGDTTFDSGVTGAQPYTITWTPNAWSLDTDRAGNTQAFTGTIAFTSAPAWATLPATDVTTTVTVSAGEATALQTTAKTYTYTYGQKIGALTPDDVVVKSGTTTVVNGAWAWANATNDAVAGTQSATFTPSAPAQNGGITYAPLTTNLNVAVTPANQTITFTKNGADVTTASATYGDTLDIRTLADTIKVTNATVPSIEVGTGGSTLTFGISGTDVATINGTTLTFKKPGTVRILVTAPATTGKYNAAVKEITLTVGKKTLQAGDIHSTLTFADQVYNGKSKTDITGRITGELTAANVTNFQLTYARANANKGDSVVVNATITQIQSDYYQLSGDLTLPVGNVKVTAKPVTYTYAGAPLTKEYDKTTALTEAQKTAIAGVAVTDVISGDEATINATSAHYASADIANNLAVSGLTLTGAEAGNYTLTTQTVKANITKATPKVTITAPTALTVDSGTKLSDITLTGTHTGVGDANVTGTLAWDNASDTVTGGNLTKGWTFTPNDTNYKAVSGTITFKLTAVKDTTLALGKTSSAYSGTNITLPTVTVSSGTAVAAANYTVKWTDSKGATVTGAVKNADTYTCTVTMKNAELYNNPAPATFTVTRATLTGALTATKTYDTTAVLTAANLVPPTLTGVGGETFTVTGLTGAAYASASVHTSTRATMASAITVTGNAGADAANYDLTALSGISITGAITAAPITGVPTIAGTVAVGKTLTANASDIKPTVAQAGLTYQWKANGINIGTNATTYTLTEAEIGKTITVTVTAAGNYTGSQVSVPTAAVPKIALTGAPAISITADGNGNGVANVSDVLTAAQGTLPTAIADYDLQWLRDGVAISGATNATYTIAQADVDANAGAGAHITCRATAKTTSSYTGSAISNALTAGKISITAIAAITGNAKFGATLTAGAVTPAGAAFGTGYTLQWYRADNATGTGKTAIGTGAQTYTTVAADVGKFIFVTATGTGTYGGNVSAHTAEIAKADAPAAPMGVDKTNVVADNDKTGTLTGVTAGMEYSTDVNFTSPTGTAITGTTVTGVPAGTYYVRLAETATTKAGAATAALVIAPAVPNQVTGVAASGNGQLSITWAKPKDNGSAITKYIVDVKTADGKSIATYPQNVTGADTLSLLVGSLNNGTAYTITVQAVNAVGAGKISAAITATPTAPSSGGGGGGGVSVYTVTYDAGKNGKLDGKATETVVSGSAPKNMPKVIADKGFKFTGWSLDGKTAVDMKTVKILASTKFTALYEAAPILNKEDHMAYIKGYVDGTFKPNAKITRAEVAAIFSRIFQDAEGKTVSGKSIFSDVAEGEWYTPYIMTMEQAGMLKGYEDGTFRPDATITREEFIAMATRVTGVVAAADMPFSDVAGHWSIDNIYTAFSNGWISGYEDGTFRPTIGLTRAEAVKLVNSMLERHIDAESIAGAEYRTFSDVKTSYWAYYDIIEAANAHTYVKQDGKETWTVKTEAEQTAKA